MLVGKSALALILSGLSGQTWACIAANGLCVRLFGRVESLLEWLLHYGQVCWPGCAAVLRSFPRGKAAPDWLLSYIRECTHVNMENQMSVWQFLWGGRSIAGKAARRGRSTHHLAGLPSHAECGHWGLASCSVVSHWVVLWSLDSRQMT